MFIQPKVFATQPPVLYCISFETYTFMMTIRSPQSFADSPQIIADSYAKSVVFI